MHLAINLFLYSEQECKVYIFFHNFVLFGRCFRCLLVTINDFVHRYVSHHILNSLVINQSVKNLQFVPLSIVCLKINTAKAIKSMMYYKKALENVGMLHLCLFFFHGVNAISIHDNVISVHVMYRKSSSFEKMTIMFLKARRKSLIYSAVCTCK